MNRTKKIKKILDKNLLNFTINVIDDSSSHKGHYNFSGNDETHLVVELKKKSESNVNRLEIHKKINSLIAEEFKIGLHSLQIKIT